MLKYWLFCGVLCSITLVIRAGDMGPGVWSVHFIKKCEEEVHKFKFDIVQKKINRTHDGFNADLILEETFNSDFGVRIDICKYVDGGCKQYQVLSDDCFVNFVNKYAENNVRNCLEIAGVDPPEFPIKEGEYHVTGYEFDYSELPSDGMYGIYCARAFILRGSQETGCVEIHVEFKEVEDDDDDCDDE
ncbi:uncharacterized protein LOC110383491 [Helicoverpa armigera]|uniref:uncharacterized protein LOC110383491 n=1 Tax=Helicoverpa armigera TaxID=29058 RepID=UPI003082F2C9